MRAPEASIACTVLASSASVSGRNGGLAANAMRSSGCAREQALAQPLEHLGAAAVETDRQAALLGAAAHQPHQRRPVHAAGLAEAEPAQRPDQRYTIRSHQIGGVHAALEVGRVEGLHHHVDGRHAHHAAGARLGELEDAVRRDAGPQSVDPHAEDPARARRPPATGRARADRACAAVRALAGPIRRASSVDPRLGCGAACEPAYRHGERP